VTSGSNTLGISDSTQLSWFSPDWSAASSLGDVNSGITLDVSLDAGSNYLTGMNEGEIHRVEDTGGTMIWKVQFPSRTTVSKVDILRHLIVHHG
jgi:hypothetical protein